MDYLKWPILQKRGLKYNYSKESKDQFFHIKLINIPIKLDTRTTMKIKNLEFKAKVIKNHNFHFLTF